jgi:uncharacterized protein (DUF697 family)
MTEHKETSIEEQSTKIINDHVTFSLIGGAIPIPVVDIAAVTAIQLDMIQKLAELHSVDFNKERVKSLISALVGATIGTSIGRIGASAVKAIPGIGTILGIGSQVIFSGATTYALGHVFSDHFAGKGTLFDFDVSKVKDPFLDMIQKGKEFCKDKEEATAKDDIIATISKLKTLKDSEIITEEEFEKTKKELLAKLSE